MRSASVASAHSMPSAANSQSSTGNPPAALASSRRSAVEETDWHRLGKEHFAKDMAERLYRGAHAGTYDRLIIVAPPRTLGDIRAQLHAEVRQRLVAEVDKDLTGHTVDSIEHILTAA